MLTSKSCLKQLLDLCLLVNADCVCDIIVHHLYVARRNMSPLELREHLYKFVELGFNPFSPKLSETSRVMMRSIVAKIDSAL